MQLSHIFSVERIVKGEDSSSTIFAATLTNRTTALNAPIRIPQNPTIRVTANELFDYDAFVVAVAAQLGYAFSYIPYIRAEEGRKPHRARGIWRDYITMQLYLATLAAEYPLEEEPPGFDWHAPTPNWEGYWCAEEDTEGQFPVHCTADYDQTGGFYRWEVFADRGGNITTLAKGRDSNIDIVKHNANAALSTYIQNTQEKS